MPNSRCGRDPLAYPARIDRPHTDEPDDLSLVRAARAGDRRALDQLLRRHHARIRAVCHGIGGGSLDLDDATQEAMIAIAVGVANFDGRAAFTTWAHRVAVNACLDEHRRRARRPEPVDLQTAGDRASVWPNRPLAAIDGDVADRLDIVGALATLSIEHRTVVVLRDQCGFDYAEIAEIVEIPVGTVRSRLARGRAAMAQALAGNSDGARDVSSPDPHDH